jgi:hypothetical protein
MRYIIPALFLGLNIPAVLPAQPSQPKQPGTRREPGLFEGQRGKKGEDENVRGVAGVVRNERDDLVEGAVVQIKDTKTLRVRSFITNADGQYRFNGLSTNVDYELKAKHRDQESDTKTLSVFDSRKEAVLNLTLEPPKKDERAEK